MLEIGWDDDQVALVGDDHVVANEHLEGSVEDEKQLREIVVQVRRGPIGALSQAHPVRAERSAGGAAASEQVVLDRREIFGLARGEYDRASGMDRRPRLGERDGYRQPGWRFRLLQ